MEYYTDIELEFEADNDAEARATQERLVSLLLQEERVTFADAPGRPEQY